MGTQQFLPSRVVRAVLGLAAAALATAVLACFSERGGVMAPAEGECRIAVNSPAVGSVQALVAIRDFAFQPATLRVPRGTTVRWVNCEPETVEPHTSTSDTGVWGSPLLAPGATYSRSFDEPGTFPYHCVPHPFMQARVIVE